MASNGGTGVLPLPSSWHGSRILGIAVGRNQVRFNVHEQKLRQFTSFFEKHGEPVDAQDMTTDVAGKEQSAGIRARSATEAAQPIKSELSGLLFVNGTGNGAINGTSTGTNTHGMDPNSDFTSECTASPTSTVHYYLEGSNYSDPKAFQQVVNYLYNEYPEGIKTRRDVQIALKAYVLALEYSTFPLQNMLLDRFREHYTSNKINFDDLVWIINRVEVYKGDDDQKAALTSYLTEQVAYEISDHGFDEFEKENWFFKAYLEEGDRKHRRDLFRVLAEHAHSAPPGDPAVGAYNWHVATGGGAAGVWRKPGERQDGRDVVSA